MQRLCQKVLLPMCSNDDLDAHTPVESEMIWNSDDKVVQVYNGTEWKVLSWETE